MIAYNSQLIIIEGLTGSGKSILAHFIARQLQSNNIPAGWVHEGAVPHPILLDSEADADIEGYMIRMGERWERYVSHLRSSAAVSVVEACFFNNLIETLLVHNVERTAIIQYADILQRRIASLNPTLVYLVQADLDEALARNFRRRGDGFRDYVIRYATTTPFARQNGLTGYQGMVSFWRAFVSLTDELFQRYPFRKLQIDNSAGQWEDYNRRVLDYLSIPPVTERGISQNKALPLVGTYRDGKGKRVFSVAYEGGRLTVNLFSHVRTNLIPQTETKFLAEGWPFVVSFEAITSNKAGVMRIGGQDVDYLPLVGTVATRIPPDH